MEIPFSLELTRENVYNAVITNKSKEIFRPKKGFFGHARALRGLLKQARIVVKELITEERIAKELIKEKLEILEAYTLAWERGLGIDKIINIKAVFPIKSRGQSFMLQLSKSQRERVLKATEERRKKMKADVELAKKQGLIPQTNFQMA